MLPIRVILISPKGLLIPDWEWTFDSPPVVRMSAWLVECDYFLPPASSQNDEAGLYFGFDSPLLVDWGITPSETRTFRVRNERAEPVYLSPPEIDDFGTGWLQSNIEEDILIAPGQEVTFQLTEAPSMTSHLRTYSFSVGALCGF